VRETLERATKALTVNFGGVIAGKCEATHQFRISVRRLRGLIELYQPLLQQNWFNRYREELRFLGRSVGALRDSDVLQQNLSGAATKIDELLRDALAPVQETLTERRRRQYEEATALLRSPRYEALVHSLAAPAFKQPLSLHGRLTLPELIRPLVRAVERAGAKLNRQSSPSEFHRLRVRMKRLRYALEMLDGGKTQHAKKLAKELKSTQEILGIQHDLVAAMGWLREFAASAVVPAPSLVAAGAAYELLHRRSLKLSRRAWKKWKVVRAGGTLQDIVAELQDTEGRVNDTLRAGVA
jgi:CHAD domain-containing protein